MPIYRSIFNQNEELKNELKELKMKIQEAQYVLIAKAQRDLLHAIKQQLPIMQVETLRQTSSFFCSPQSSKGLVAYNQATTPINAK
ncbi:135_t:CDS:2 [Diversispora eburnea]|uniref:135_t:CDS:1 n=1 Tax=Diversispora eburnea TaxID=1213867 RepID=A0A9N8WK86_9GLOM|nr:135_t:CDS:2 [Diversispora eburnea]